VTFHNAESGFCVLRVKARGQRDLITVVGHAATIASGEWVQMSGSWVNDRTHGLQFKAAFLKASPPTTLEGIEKYLGSGMIRGIGPVYARKLVRAFGATVFDLIEQEPARLRQVTGIGPKRAARIIAGWAEQKVIREIMLFLHANGVGTSRAVRICKTQPCWRTCCTARRHGFGATRPIAVRPTSSANTHRRPATSPTGGIGTAGLIDEAVKPRTGPSQRSSTASA